MSFRLETQTSRNRCINHWMLNLQAVDELQHVKINHITSEPSSQPPKFLYCLSTNFEVIFTLFKDISLSSCVNHEKRRRFWELNFNFECCRISLLRGLHTCDHFFNYYISRSICYFLLLQPIHNEWMKHWETLNTMNGPGKRRRKTHFVFICWANTLRLQQKKTLLDFSFFRVIDEWLNF